MVIEGVSFSKRSDSSFKCMRGTLESFVFRQKEHVSALMVLHTGQFVRVKSSMKVPESIAFSSRARNALLLVRSARLPVLIKSGGRPFVRSAGRGGTAPLTSYCRGHRRGSCENTMHFTDPAINGILIFPPAPPAPPFFGGDCNLVSCLLTLAQTPLTVDAVPVRPPRMVSNDGCASFIIDDDESEGVKRTVEPPHQSSRHSRES